MLMAAGALLTGCGSGSGAATTVTVAPPASISPPTVTTDPNADLKSFELQLAPVAATINAEARKANKAIDKFNSNRTLPQLHTLGVTLTGVSKRWNSATVKLATITAPPSLKAAYTGLVDEETAEGGYVDASAIDAKHEQLDSVNSDMAKITTMKRTHFKVALIAALRQAGLPVPNWVKQIGQRD
jgi:hypothetical protein